MDFRRTLLAVILLALPTLAAERQEKPNVVFFLVDDLGWADLSCYGSTFCETPNIDALATSGLRFTSAYSAGSICSPTRAAIMTGQHPVRVNITDWIPGDVNQGQPMATPTDRDHLPLGHTTIAEAFRNGGYTTFYAGKWHLGGESFSPVKQGFDYYYDPHYAAHMGSPGNAAHPTGRRHASVDLTRETMNFLSAHRGKPQFVYLAYFDVHAPIIAEDEYLEHYTEKAAALGPTPEPVPEHDGLTRPRQDNAALATMVQTVDRSVGRILTHLDTLGLAENTIVVFYSDNGGLATLAKPGPTSNHPLRAGKGWLYEGGIRVPLIIRSPGSVRRGATSAYPVNSMDLYPTLLELAGLSLKPRQHIDGQSFAPLFLEASPELAERPLFWHYPHYHGSTWTPGAAIRSGNWKLIEFYHYGGYELYDLDKDLGEQNNLVERNPAKAEALLNQLHDWQQGIGAQLPTRRQQ